MPTPYQYTAEDLLNPQGSNGKGSRTTFHQRLLYKEHIYPADRPDPLDTWYDKFLYGRIDRSQNTVVPATINLVPIPSAKGPNLMALNAVVTAFEKFSTHMKKGVAMSAVNKSGNPHLLDVKAVGAYRSPNAKYANYTQGLYNTFKGNLKGAEKRQIKDFESFLKFYKRYLLDVAANIPITKTNYLLTSHCSLFSTGASIAIAGADPSLDAIKYADFITDPNFEFYRQCSKKFGFVLNKNAPWVLTADLFSQAFEFVALGNYVTPSGRRISRDNFFDTFYDRTYKTDFDDLVNLLINSYTTLVKAAPFYDEEKGTIDEKCTVVASQREVLMLKPAQVLDGTAPANMLSHKSLIDFYIDLRQIEIQSPLTAKEISSLKVQAYEVYQVHPVKTMTALQNVADFVNGVFRNYIYGNGAIDLQFKNAKVIDNRAAGGRILVERASARQLY
jgi:hypothetical protein